MPSTEDISDNNGLLEQYLQCSVSELLDLFPTPPSHIPKNAQLSVSLSLYGAGSKDYDSGTKKGFPGKRGRVGSILRSSWASQDGSQSGNTSGSGKKNSPTKDKLVASGNQGSSSTLGSVDLNTAPSTASALNNTISSSGAPTGQFFDAQDPDKFKYTVPTGLPDRDYLDLLKRACKGVIAPKDQDVLFKFLLALPPSKMMQLQKAMHEKLNDRNSGLKGSRSSATSVSDTFGRAGTTFVDVSKYNLDFNLRGRNVKINEEVYDSVSIDAKGNKILKFTFVTPGIHPGYEIKVEPQTGKLKPKDKPEEIRFSLQIRRPVVLSEVVFMEIEGGYKHFFCINVSSEWSNFGSALEELEEGETEIFPGLKRKIPKVLILMRQLLVEKNGLEVEEIFRKQVDEEKMMLSRAQFDQKNLLGEMTAEIVSNLIKIWFRELPVRIFDVDMAEVLACDSEQKTLELFEKIQGKQREVALWFLDFMAEVLSKKEKNRMTSKKLGIVLAPNLFRLNNGGTNAECLRKQAEIFNILVENHINKNKL